MTYTQKSHNVHEPRAASCLDRAQGTTAPPVCRRDRAGCPKKPVCAVKMHCTQGTAGLWVSSGNVCHAGTHSTLRTQPPTCEPQKRGPPLCLQLPGVAGAWPPCRGDLREEGGHLCQPLPGGGLRGEGAWLGAAHSGATFRGGGTKAVPGWPYHQGREAALGLPVQDPSVATDAKGPERQFQ